MTKKVVSLILLGAVLISMMGFTLPYIWYYSDYDYIVTYLCINRDHPEMNCNGSCQLDKMVRKIHKKHNQDNQQTDKTAQKQRINYYFSGCLFIPVLPPLFSFTFHIKEDLPKSLWFKNILTPPPKIG